MSKARTSNPNHGRPNGRAARIRQFLAENRGQWSAREIAEGIGESDRTCVSSSLNVMAKRSYVKRHGFGHGVKWSIGHVHMPQERQGGIEITPRPVPGGRGPLPRRAELAREVIAADLAAFEAAGGRIQKLEVTRLFADPTDAANVPAPARRARRGQASQ